MVVKTIETIHISIEGTRPLLMHAPTMIGKTGGQTKKTSNYDPEVEAANALYKDKNNTICIPGMAVLGALRKAATEHKAPGRGKKTLKDFVYSGLRVDQDMIPVSPQTYEIDARPVVVQRNRVIRWRPRFDTWNAEFDISIMDDSVWNATSVRNVLEDAGRFVGLLDFRPLFGTFEVKAAAVNGKEVK